MKIYPVNKKNRHTPHSLLCDRREACKESSDETEYSNNILHQNKFIMTT